MAKPRDLSKLGGGFIQSGTGAVQRTVDSAENDKRKHQLTVIPTL